MGSHFVDHVLEWGWRVVRFDNFDDFYGLEIKEQNLAAAMDHAQFTLVEGDIRDRPWFVGFPHPIVHFASRVGVRLSIYDRLLYADVNLMGRSLLLGFA